MLMPSIFGENLFNDDWMDFSFPDVDKELYGKHAKNVMKTDVKETDNSYEVDIDLPGFKKDEIEAKLENGYLTISAAKGLDKNRKISRQSMRTVFLNFQFRRRNQRKLRPQNILLLKDKLNLNHLMRSRTGLWPGRLFKLKSREVLKHSFFSILNGIIDS